MASFLFCFAIILKSDNSDPLVVTALHCTVIKIQIDCVLEGGPFVKKSPNFSPRPQSHPISHPDQ